MTNKQEERKAQHRLLSWAREQGFKCYATANGQFLNSWSAIRERSTMGKGLPDLVILLPSERSNMGTTMLFFLEMKKEKGGTVSKEQKEFILLANSVKGNCFAHVAHGFHDAKAYLEQFLAPLPELSDEEVNQIIETL